MAEINPEQIEEIVSQVINNLRSEGRIPSDQARSSKVGIGGSKSQSGIHPSTDQAIMAAKQAQAEFVQLGFAKRREIIEAIKRAALENAQRLADLAVEDTGMGNAAHKLMKNEGAVNLSPGVEDLRSEASTGDEGTLLVEYVPFGVINSITPTTNPTSTVINHAIIMLSAGNAIVFSPHPNAAVCTHETMRVINEAIVKSGGPPNLLTAVADATLRTAKEIMNHDDISMVVATGGPSVVKAALNSGKKAIAAGPGNPAALIDETADVAKAAKDTQLTGRVLTTISSALARRRCLWSNLSRMKPFENSRRTGGYLLNANELKAVERTVIKDGDVNKDFIGKDARVILEAARIRAPANTVAIVADVPADHTFIMDEYLMPILPVARMRNFDEALKGAVAAEGGRGHTAILHTNDMKRITQFNKAMDCNIVVVNAPSYACAGLGGEGFLAMTIAGPTGEGFTRPRTFTQQRRLTIAGDLSEHTL